MDVQAGHWRRPEVMVTRTASVLVLIFCCCCCCYMKGAEGYWCVTRSDASEEALQTALDYACWAGADCAPIQSTGLCYLPNTIQAHASYAFNSYYQRKNAAPGSCDFAGTATLAKTDPSFGSCVYPPNPSTAGMMGSSTPGTTTPSTTTSSTPTVATPSTTNPTSMAGSAGFAPNLGPPSPITANSTNNNHRNKSLQASLVTVLLTQFSLYFFFFFHY